jgi:hypothetical protein
VPRLANCARSSSARVGSDEGPESSERKLTMGGNRLARAGSSMSLLCSMMDPHKSTAFAWTASDMAAIAAHLLASELGNEIALDPDGKAARYAARMGLTHSRGGITIGDVLVGPAPSKEVLFLAKTIVKGTMGGVDGFPDEVGKAIYTAIIARARHLGYSDVSRLRDAEFLRLSRWCLAQPWVPSIVARVVRGAVEGGKNTRSRTTKNR